MEQLFAQLDAACPENLFTFLANAESVAGELTPFALRIARQCSTLEELRRTPPAKLQRLCAQMGMPPTSAERLVQQLNAPDPRFEHPVVRPLPRWALLVGEIFDIIDVDRNGHLDLGEYMALATGGASPFSFFFADKDGSGTVDKAEFLAMHLDSPEAGRMTETALEGCCTQMKRHLLNRRELRRDGLAG